MLRNFLHRHALVLRQRMGLGHHHLDFVAKNGNHFHVVGRLGQRDDAHVYRAFLHFLQNLVAEVAVNADLHQGVELLEFRESLGQDVKAGGFVGADRQLAARSLVQLGNGLQSLFLKSSIFSA